MHIRPNCEECHEKLGRALLAANDLPGSVSELEEATRLNPNDAKAHFELGRVLRQAGQMDRANQEFAASKKLYSAHSQNKRPRRYYFFVAMRISSASRAR